MKKIITLGILGILLASCSSDSENSEDNFFNLNTGNLRVYKRFISGDGITFSPTTRIDSVFTTGDTIISGLTYEKFYHKVYEADVFVEPHSFTETLRVDANGHLVNVAGFVLHPGYDQNFTAIREYFLQDELYGNINYQSENPMDVMVEGETYNVYPYIGNYIPLDPGQEEQSQFDYYKPGVGLVNQHCSALMGTSCYEARLISYQIN